MVMASSNRVKLNPILSAASSGKKIQNSVQYSQLNDDKKLNINTGNVDNTEDIIKKSPLKETLAKNLLGLWGVFQVVSILGNAVKRLFPIALQPIVQKDLSPIHWIFYGGWSLFMAYAEGYKGFQLKFSPLVVDRAFSLSKNPSILNYIFAGPYSMGLFNAPKKRIIIGWSLTVGIFGLVRIVKLLPYPFRSIVDAGVVVGLSYGLLSVCFLTVRKLFQK
jgi:hypothetical protein